MNVYAEAAVEMLKTVVAFVAFFGGLGVFFWGLMNYPIIVIAGVIVVSFVGWYFTLVDEAKKERAGKPKRVWP